MYTANITNVTEETKGNFAVTATINTGTETLTHTFKGIVSKEGAEQAVRSWAHSLQLTPPSVGTVKLEDDPAPTLTPEQIKEQTIAIKKQELEQSFNDLQKKLITEAEYDLKVVEFKTLLSEPVIKVK